MAVIQSAITLLQTLIILIGAAFAVMGIVNMLEGYGNEKPNARSQGIKQLMAGGGIVLIGMQLIPQLAGLF